MGTVAGVGAWAEWVCSELGDLVVAGASSLESCEVSVDLMEAIGASGLLGRGQVAQSRVERASGLVVGAASAWHEALQAVLAMDARGTEAAGVAGKTEVPAGGDVVHPAGKVEFPGDVGSGNAGPAGPGPGGADREGTGAGPGDGSPVGGRSTGGGGAGEIEAAEVRGPGDAPVAGGGPGPGAAGAAGAAGGVTEAGEVPVRAESRWDRMKDKVPFQHAAVHGPLRGWGFTERSWKKTASGGCELALVPAAGHVPHSDPVNDVFWVEAVDEQGTVVEGHPLFSTRDRAGGREQYVEPGTRRALGDLAEEKALPKATSAGVKAGVGTGMGTAASVVATDGGQAAATVLASGTGVVAGGTGLLAGWAAHKIVLKRRGEVRDPTAPRTVRFSRSLEEMKDLRVRVRRGDHPRQAREAARTDTLALLERRAREHGVSGAQLKRTRGRIKSLPGFPRGDKSGVPPERCQEAVLMHVPEGRERLVRTLLELDDQNGKG